MKQGKINEKIYHRLRTIGLQPARLYGLAKVHKIGTPLRSVLSIPGSSYENLNKFLSPFFGKLPGANIETNSKDARAAPEDTDLLRYIKLVCRFGLFCQYPVAVTRTSINFSLPLLESYQVQILRLIRKMPERL